MQKKKVLTTFLLTRDFIIEREVERLLAWEGRNNQGHSLFLRFDGCGACCCCRVLSL